MKFILIILFSMTGMMNAQNSLFSFSNNENEKGWLIVNDGVMGGLSQGNFEVVDGHIKSTRMEERAKREVSRLFRLQRLAATKKRRS